MVQQQLETNLIHLEEQNGKMFDVQNLHVFYGEQHALKNISMTITKHQVTAIIGPSGCGKSTFLKTLNRMVETVSHVKMNGEILLENESLLNTALPIEQLRARVGMVFQKPNPFPKSIYDNVAYGPRIHGIKNKKVLDEIVEFALKQAAIWDEVKDRLHTNANALSGGQQQRICIARCLAIEPDVILMDEPTSALDPISTLKIEQLIERLKQRYTIVIVTHNMQQAARVSDQTAFFLNGELIEMGATANIFSKPLDRRTADYVAGRFG